MNGYLVPSSAKRGTLIFNIFRPFDLILFSVGVVISILLLIILPTENIVMAILGILPGCITGLLVFPIPNYHNVLCVLQSVNRFYSERRRYVWKGWCLYEQFKRPANTKR